jgi:hypothetical protein
MNSVALAAVLITLIICVTVVVSKWLEYKKFENVTHVTNNIHNENF